MTKELFDMHGQVAVVTGAASGLGLATAEVLARAGAKVVLLDIWHSPKPVDTFHSAV